MKRMASFLFLTCGLAVLVYGIGIIRESRAMAKWPTVTGKIISAEAQQTVRAAGTENQRYAPQITFEFTYAGTLYRGDRVTLIPKDSRGTAGVNAVLQRYPINQPVLVHVNPGDPARSVLEIAVDTNHWAYALAGICLIGVGVYHLVLNR